MIINLGDVFLNGGASGGGGGTGSSNYNDLSNKPKINNVTLSGNKTAADLGLATAEELTELASTVGSKLNSPSTAGTAGQVLTLDDGLNPIWDDPQGGGGGDTDDLQDAAASALCELHEKVENLRRGLVNTGTVIVHEELANIYKHVQSMIDVTEDIIASAFCALNETRAVIESVADPYRGYLTYAVGDVVSNEGKVWQCNTAVNTPEIFDRSKWTQTSIANIIANL